MLKFSGTENLICCLAALFVCNISIHIYKFSIPWFHILKLYAINFKRVGESITTTEVFI